MRIGGTAPHDVAIVPDTAIAAGVDAGAHIHRQTRFRRRGEIVHAATAARVKSEPIRGARRRRDVLPHTRMPGVPLIAYMLGGVAAVDQRRVELARPLRAFDVWIGAIAKFIGAANLIPAHPILGGAISAVRLFEAGVF